MLYEVWGGGWSWWGLQVVIQFHITHLATHTTHACMHTAPITSLVQLLLHLPPKWLHVWVAFCRSGHLTILPQSVLSGVVCQVMVQELTGVFSVGGSNTWLDIFCDDTFTNEPKQTQSGVDNLKKVCLMFLEKFRYWKLCVCKSPTNEDTV